MNDPLVGRTLGGFRIERFISKGSAGRVYEAVQVALNRRVALKVLEEGLFTPQDFRVRFQRESEYLARLEHPNIVPIYAAGSEEKYTFYAMRFVDGRTLDQLMGEGLVARDGLRWLADIAGALAYIHEHEIIHRDLKPSNIMISDDSAMLTDFGIARFMQTTTITDTGTLLGTPLYMSPEQARREKASAASDLYALGVIAYELVACRHPFMDRRTESDIARDSIFKRIAAGLCESPRAWIPEIPGRLEAVILEAMALEPAERPADAAALRATLLEAAALPGLDRLDAARERALGIRVTSPTQPAPAHPRIIVAEAPTVEGAAFGDYILQSEIGKGGMGVVYRAVQRSLDRVVAVKVLPFAADEEDVARFRREAAAAANLRHPNIVTVHEAGTVENRHYYAMELVEGEDLDAHLARERPNVRRAMEIIRDVARAIRYAHEQGVIHRDLKPGNVLIDAQGRVLIADFGLAKILKAGSLTATGAVMGTPAYMAPEQARGAAIDVRADVYGMGALLYHMLAGVQPFRGGDPMEILVDVIANEPASPRALNPKVHPDAETICLRAMEKEPARRYSDAAAFLDDVERFLDGEPIQARPVGRLPRLWRRLRRRPAAMAAVAVVLAAAALLLLQSVRFAREREALDEVRWAESHYRAGDLDETERRAARALDLAPDLGPAHFWRGRVVLRRYQEHRRLPAVWRTYGEVSFSPLPPESLDAAALRDAVRARFAAASGLGGWERAFADGTLALFDGRAAEAAPSLDAVLRAYALEWEPYLLAGLAHFYARDFAGALDAARAGRERWKGELPLAELEARALLALAHEGLLVGDDPGPRCRDVLTLCVLGRIHEPGDARWPALAAQAHLLMAEHAEATGGDPEPSLRGALDEVGDAAGAEALTVRGDALVRRAVYRYKRGRVDLDDFSEFEAALAAFDAAAAAAPDDAVPIFKRAEARYRLAEHVSQRAGVGAMFPLILADYRRALELSPSFVDAQIGLAMAEAIEGEFAAASPDQVRESYARAVRATLAVVEARPEYARARLAAATVHIDLAKRMTATGQDPRPVLLDGIALMDEALKSHPRYAEGFIKRGHLRTALLLPAYRSGSGDDDVRRAALADFEAASAVNPTSFEAHEGAAQVWFNEGIFRQFAGGDAAAAFDASDAEYVKALAVNPASPTAIAARGNIELNRGNLDSAVAFLDRALELSPYLPDALYGRLKAAQARAEVEAVELAERYVRTEPRNPESHLMLGVLCGLRARAEPEPWSDRAEDAFGKAIGINARYIEAYIERAQFRAHMSRWKEAVADIDKARALDGAVVEKTEALRRHCIEMLGSGEDF